MSFICKYGLLIQADHPRQRGQGVRFDFSDGFRLLLPSEEPWYVQLTDAATQGVLHDGVVQGADISSIKKYYVNFVCEVWEQGERIFEHSFNCTAKPVLMRFPEECGLGDAIGWFPYVVKFQQQHQCELTCMMPKAVIPLFAGVYPDIRFIAHTAEDIDGFYATYRLGHPSDDPEFTAAPCDHRVVGTHRIAAYILGVDPTECPPKIALDDAGPPIDEPYVCIGTQSTAQCKYWNNPNGWREVIAFLKTLGYRVICIDRDPVAGAGFVWNHLPHGAEDQTGDRPLLERARWLRHAEAFIGLASGLSWLAWAVGTPTVMISGFSHPNTEFYTPYRVINFHSCNSCWNDARFTFDHHDFLWCPRHAGTSRQFECSRTITPEQVIQVLRRVPAVMGRVHAKTAQAPDDETPMPDRLGGGDSGNRALPATA